VRRRETPKGPDEYEGTPIRLARFVASEWPDAETELEAAGLWWRAREAWEAENGRDAFLDFDDPDSIPPEPWNPDWV
jgi:hypothetical protein